MAKQDRRRSNKRKQQQQGALRVKRARRSLVQTALEYKDSNMRSIKDKKNPYGTNYNDTVPYKTDSIQANATFESRGDGSLHRYFSAPRGIQVDMTSAATENQIPLLDMVREFARELDTQPISSSKKAVTRGFHIQMTRTNIQSGVPYSKKCSSEQQSYLTRCNTNRPLPTFSLNMGVRLELLNTVSQTFSLKDTLKEGAQNAINMSTNLRETIHKQYMQDSEQVERIMTDAGFEPIDFNNPKQNANNKKYHEITSWMCNPGEYLENSGIGLPLHGNSAILPNEDFDEVVFYIATLKRGLREEGVYYSPDRYIAKYAREFFRPENSVVHVSIRGEIMSMKHTREELAISEDVAFDKEQEQMSQEDIRLSVIREMGEKRDLATMAQIAGRYNPLIKDTVIVVGAKTAPGEEPHVVSQMRKRYDIEMIPARGHQIDAIHATLPGFNKPIFTNGKKRWISRRSKSSMQRVLPGAVFMSGIFNSSIPPTREGVFIGLSNSFMENKALFIDPGEISRATEGEHNPGISITGRPNAGKALPLDTKVRLASGYTKAMKDVKVGDILIDMNGDPTSVIWKSDVMHHDCIKLNIHDGTSFVSDEDHLWPVVDQTLAKKTTTLLVELMREKNNSRSPLNKSEDRREYIIKKAIQSGLWNTEQEVLDSLHVNYFDQAFMQDSEVSTYNTIVPGDLCCEGLYDSLINRLMQMSVYSSENIVKLTAREIHNHLKTRPHMELVSVTGFNSLKPDMDTHVSISDLETGKVSIEKLLSTASLQDLQLLASFIVHENKTWVEEFRPIMRAAGYDIKGNTTSQKIVSTEYVGKKDVACISVDSQTTSFLLEDLTVTSNTTLLKQIAVQSENNGLYCAFFNFKGIDPIMPWWRETMKEGVSVAIDQKLLSNQLGCLDPFNFYDRAKEEGSEITKTISEAITLLWEKDRGNQAYNSGFAGTSLDAAVSDRVRNPLARCTGDVIFGSSRNPEIQALFYEAEKRCADDNLAKIAEFTRIASEHNVVPPLPFKQVRTMVADAIKGDSYTFWKAFVSRDGMANDSIARAVVNGKPILFEWGESFSPPAENTSIEHMTVSQFDASLSAFVTLRYAKSAAVRYQKITGKSGFIMMDEVAGVLSIPRFYSEIVVMMREFRAIGYRLVFGTQRMIDLGDKIESFISVHIIGAISSANLNVSSGDSKRTEQEKFFDIIGVDENDEYRKQEATQFILNAGLTKDDDGQDRASRQVIEHAIPYAWYVDKVNQVNTPFMMGEFPIKELLGGKSDDEKHKLQRRLEDESWQNEKAIRDLFTDGES